MIFYFSYSQTHAGFEDIVRVFPPESSNALPIRYVASLIIITMFTYIAAPLVWTKDICRCLRKNSFYCCWNFQCFSLYSLFPFQSLHLHSYESKGIIGINPEEGIPYIINTYFPNGLRGCRIRSIICGCCNYSFRNMECSDYHACW
jgi:Na+/proline symporter